MHLALTLTDDLIEQYLDHASNSRRLRPSTIGNYREDLRSLRAATGVLSTDGARTWICRGARGQELAPSTSNRRLAVLRGFAKYLIREGVIIEDPTAGIGRAPEPRVRRAYPTARAVQLLLDAADVSDGWFAKRDRAIIHLFFYTGLRLSELLALNLEQVDLGERMLREARRKGGHITDEYLTADCAREIRQYLTVRPQSDDPSLILSSRRRRPTPRAIQKRLAHLGDLAGLQVRIHPHALRHAHASALNRLGAPLPVIQDSLNHASPKTTRRYVHLADDEVRRARDRLPKMRRSSSRPCRKDPQTPKTGESADSP